MRALVCKDYGSPDALVLEDVDDPVAGAGEIVVDIRAAGLNFPDVLVIGGQYQVKTPPPFIPGHEAAGVVTAVGDGAERFAVGDKVIVTPSSGAFAERCAVPENLAMPVPEGLDFGQAAGFTITYSTSYHALVQHAKLKESETVLPEASASPRSRSQRRSARASSPPRARTKSSNLQSPPAPMRRSTMSRHH
jgi:NADPH2:quinone reductase